MLMFTDSFDGYNYADITQKWMNVTNYSIGSGRHGSNSLRASISSAVAYKSFSPQSTIIVGFAFKTAGLTTGTILQFLDSGTVQCSLQLGSDGRLSVLNSIGTSIGTVAGTLIFIDTWYYIEMKVTISNSIAVDSCVVRINEAIVINVAAGYDLQNTTNAYANQIALKGTGSYNVDFDDIYICDGSGTVNNTFLGDTKITAQHPTANGSSLQFNPSVASNWQNIDDPAFDGDATYNESITVGHMDLFPVPPLTTNPLFIHAVQVVYHGRKVDGPARVRSVLRIGGVNYFGVTWSLGDSYGCYLDFWDLNPSNGLPWTKVAYESCEVGYQCVS